GGGLRRHRHVGLLALLSRSVALRLGTLRSRGAQRVPLRRTPAPPRRRERRPSRDRRSALGHPADSGFLRFRVRVPRAHGAGSRSRGYPGRSAKRLVHVSCPGPPAGRRPPTLQAQACRSRRHRRLVVRAPTGEPAADARDTRLDGVARWRRSSGGGTGALARAVAEACPDLGALLARTGIVARGPRPLAALRELGVPGAHPVPEPFTWRQVLAVVDGLDLPRGGLAAVQEYGAPVP